MNTPSPAPPAHAPGHRPAPTGGVSVDMASGVFGVSLSSASAERVRFRPLPPAASAGAAAVDAVLVGSAAAV